MRNNESKLSLNTGNGHSTNRSTAQVPELAVDTLELLAGRLKDHWKRYRKQLRKCRRKFSEKTVHDLRVEARRLISLLDLLCSFVPASCVTKAHEELKCHLDTFDDLRDTQVQLAVARKLRKRFVAARHFHDFLKKCEADLRKIARKQAKQLQVKPLSKLVKTARDCAKRWLRGHSTRQANLRLLRAVTRAFERTKHLKDRIDPSDTHSIHCTRIAFKKFRYMIEALADRPGTAGKDLLERLRRYQGLMGDIQDAEVLLRSFEKFFRKEKTEVGPALQFTEASLQNRRKLIEKYLASADDLLQFWPSFRGTGSAVNLRRKTQPKPASQ